MAKWITIAVVAGLFFSVGKFAGHSVPSAEALAASSIETSNPNRPAAQKPTRHIQLNSTAVEDSLPIALISHSTTIENAEFRTVESMGQSVASDKHRNAIRNLIQQTFPEMDEASAEIWVESYADMSLDEITFVLEQKRLTSKGNGASLPAMLMSPFPSLTDSTQAKPQPSGPEQAGDIDVKMVEANLRSAYSLGFRRMVVLPEAIADLESWTSGKSPSVPVTSFRSFESGPLIGSPVATHVALTKVNSTMFCLEGNRLTRRGDFQVLADRRLGIVTRGEEIASTDSTVLPDGATDVRILQNGIIQFRDTAGVTGKAGRITVCSVNDLANLRTDDGVFFTVNHDGDIIRHEDASAFLLTHKLEQSNVDRSYETSLLTHLKSLSSQTGH